MSLTFTQILVDTANGNLHCYSKEEANDVIRKEFATVLGIDENEKNFATIRRAIRKNKADFYTIIEVAIEKLMVTGWGDNPFFRQMVEERNIAEGDENQFYVKDDSILTCSKVAGDHHDLIRQKLGMGKSYQVEMSTYAIKVYDEFIRFQAGRVDWTELVNAIYEAADKKVNDILYDSFLGLKDMVDSNLKVTGSVDAEKILELADKVQAITGREVMLVGTRAGLSKVSNLVNSGWISNEMKTERNTTGYVGRFEGLETMVIPQAYNKDTMKPYYDNKTILVLPKTDDKPIKLVWQGDSVFNESIDSTTNMDATIEAEYQFKMGVSTIIGADFGLVTFDN